MTTHVIADILAPLDDLPDRFKLFTAGTNSARWVSGEQVSFLVDETAARSVIAAFDSLGHDIVIDWEHQSEGGLLSSITGQAPAAGWITALEWVPNDGLFATASWTETAAGQLKRREYRFFSPVFEIDPENNRVLQLFSVALTNTPAILDIEPIAATRVRGDLIMTPEEFIAAVKDALGLAPEATMDEAIAAIAAIQEALAAANEPASGAPADAEAADASAASANVPDPDKWVAASTFTARVAELQTELDTIRAAERARGREEFITAGMRDGKIVAATCAVWETVYDNDPENRDARLKEAPVIADPRLIAATSVDTVKTNRQNTIATAAAEYSDNVRHIACNRVQYINQCLRETSEPGLTSDEQAAL